ncbi:Acetyltransferase (isoleucine patch superfamily) [Ruminococcus sp. YE71]|uniref:DapH/DapD/GlmU-related protein n=1 Tax=unclassified Ruminococcus TaxID=2608920 RepID=UPI0008925EFD|nr:MULTISPECIES: DapH/DapD/GlmU-related protein [unclassified Ruminococcus]SDA16666.1 Acetyltransferase (isoleucine patch superfamily) [Ruminococcus sp. YE78]SFW25460.1 Acetyltransferase (isoleucine patch superfamily) [Ruminococcus sp. YE71]
METAEIRTNMYEHTSMELEKNRRTLELLFRINHTMPLTDEYSALLKELLGDGLGEGSVLMPPIQMTAPEMVKLGKNVLINGNSLFMAMGGVTLEDDVMVAANVQFLTNNHDLYDRQQLTCKPILVRKGAWIGAGASIMPGVCIGRYAVVGAAAVVTKDVPDYAVVIGCPAKVVRELDPKRFEDI